jgi:hypothetical protein
MPPAAQQIRRLRDTLAGWGAAALAFGAVLVTAAAVLDMTEVLHSGIPAGLGVGHGLIVLSGALSVIALGVVSAGFFAAARARFNLLGAGALLVAVAFFAQLAGGAVISVVYLQHHANGKLSASAVLVSLAALPVVIAGVIAWRTFAAYNRVGSQPQSRDVKLGVAAATAALATVLLGASEILLNVLYSDLGVPSGYTGGGWVQIAGEFVLGAGVIAVAVAFLTARTSADPDGRVRRRDGVLAGGVLVLAFSYMLQFTGGAIAASSGAHTVLSSKELAVAWLNASQSFIGCAAFAIAALGLLMSRSRSR